MAAYSDRNGGWSEWGSWSHQCFDNFCEDQTRNRTCSNPTQLGDGADCVGSIEESRTCDEAYGTDCASMGTDLYLV